MRLCWCLGRLGRCSDFKHQLAQPRRCVQDGGPGRPGEPPWVTFCGMYDFGHMLQLLTSQPLPDEAGVNVCDSELARVSCVDGFECAVVVLQGAALPLDCATHVPMRGTCSHRKHVTQELNRHVCGLSASRTEFFVDLLRNVQSLQPGRLVSDDGGLTECHCCR